MKIALVSPYDWCVRGGVNAHISQLADQFREWNHDITIIAPASDKKAAEQECIVMGEPVALPVSGSMARITFTWQPKVIKELLEQGQFDIVHLHEPLMPLLTYQILRYSRAINVGTFHAAKEGGNRFYGYTKPLTKRWFRKLDGKIAVSPTASQLVSRYFAGYFNIIPNGIAYDHFSKEHEPFPELMDGKLNLLFVGRPEKRKGLQYLLRSYLQLQEQSENIRLIVVGAGSFKRYEKFMEHRGADVNFRSNVPYSELPRYHASADIFCSPATGNESQGIAILEAMAAGVPVIASNIDGFAGVITDEVDGLLVQPKSDQAITDAVLRLKDNPSLRNELGQHGQLQSRSYSWESVARKVIAYYERLQYERQQFNRIRNAKLDS